MKSTTQEIIDRCLSAHKTSERVDVKGRPVQGAINDLYDCGLIKYVTITDQVTASVFKAVFCPVYDKFYNKYKGSLPNIWQKNRITQQVYLSKPSRSQFLAMILFGGASVAIPTIPVIPATRGFAVNHCKHIRTGRRPPSLGQTMKLLSAFNIDPLVFIELYHLIVIKSLNADQFREAYENRKKELFTDEDFKKAIESVVNELK